MCQILVTGGNSVLLNGGTNYRTVKTITAICFNVSIDLIGCSVKRINNIRTVSNISQRFFE